MNKFTICYNRYTWPALWQKRITSLTERMKSFTPPGRFMLLALFCFFMAGNMAGQINRIQSATGNNGTTTPSKYITLAMSANTTPGNTLIAVISTRGTAVDMVSGVSGGGATWIRAVQSTNYYGNTTEIWYSSNISVATKNIVITLSGISPWSRAAAIVMEYTGTLVLDKVASSTGNSTKPVTGTTATTTQTKELWIGGIGFSNSNYSLSSISNSFTQVANQSSGSSTTASNTRVYALEKVVTTTGQASTGGTLNISTYWSGAIATFRSGTPPDKAGTITGPTDVCQGSTTDNVYTVPTITGVSSYVWTYMGTGATPSGSPSTFITSNPSIKLNFSATATTGFLNVKGQNNDGYGWVSPNFAIQVNSPPPNPIREIITHENCPGDRDGAIKLKIPTALRFDGPIPGVTKEVSNQDGNPLYNDGVNLNGSFLNDLTGFTVEGWVNTDVTIGNVALFGQNNVVEVGFLNNKVEVYSIGIKSGNCVSDIEYPIDGKWHHIAGTGDKYRMKIYIDGILQREWVYNTADQVTNYGSSTYKARIGRQVFDDTDLQPFTGQIVKVGFWNYAMTQAEITALAGGGFRDYTTTDAGLIAGYNFYETTGDVTLEPVSNTSTSIPMGSLVKTPPME